MDPNAKDNTLQKRINDKKWREFNSGLQTLLEGCLAKSRLERYTLDEMRQELGL